MHPILQLLSKINQLRAQQRRDIVALVEALAQASQHAPRLVQMLPRQFYQEYLHGWAEATGGKRNELSRFFRGTLFQLALPNASMVNLHSNTDFLIFSALFSQSSRSETFVRPDVMEAFYVLQGSLELTLPARHDRLCFILEAGDAHQLYPGKPYQFSADAGCFIFAVHCRAPESARQQAFSPARSTALAQDQPAEISCRGNES